MVAMKILKPLIFIATLVAVFIAVARYSHWSALQQFSYLAIGFIFTVISYYLYKGMFTDDE
jgi:H+/Cl- antiporter ClcA